MESNLFPSETIQPETESKDDSIEAKLLVELLSSVARIEGMLLSMNSNKRQEVSTSFGSTQLDDVEFPPLSFFPEM